MTEGRVHSFVYLSSNGMWYVRCDTCKTIDKGWKTQDGALAALADHRWKARCDPMTAPARTQP